MKYLFIFFIVLANSHCTTRDKNKANEKMRVAVWDTYVTKKDKSIMHFDILVPADVKDTSVIYNYGRAYLKTKNQEGQMLSAKECKFCHIEKVDPSREAEIVSNGYYIIEIDNCE